MWHGDRNTVLETGEQTWGVSQNTCGLPLKQKKMQDVDHALAEICWHNGVSLSLIVRQQCHESWFYGSYMFYIHSWC